MARYLIKPVAAEDFYVLWSTVVDAPIDWGTRAELEVGAPELTADRFERADRKGTSAHHGFYSFDEEDRSVIVEQAGSIDVARLRELTDLLDPSDGSLTDEAIALLTPLVH